MVQSSVIIMGKNTQINHVKMDTNMDFGQVDNILISDPVPIQVGPQGF